MTKQSVVWDGWQDLVSWWSWLAVRERSGCRQGSLCASGLAESPRFPRSLISLLANVAADTRINGRFATTDIRKLKGHLCQSRLYGEQEDPASIAGAI